jgi:hypothetical protein
MKEITKEEMEGTVDVVTKHFNVNQLGNSATVMQEIVTTLSVACD